PRPAASAPASAGPRAARPLTLRPMPAAFRPEVVAIGSSTGGPQALFDMLGGLGGPIDRPILITQHMPATFTAILAQHLSRHCRVDATEAADGEAVVPGRIYVAPGDWHMTVAGSGSGLRIKLEQTPPENFCRPSVDPMLRSLVQACGGRVLTVMLTGMGHDGLDGCRAVAEAGGAMIAQDEATSVVWGMPGAVAQAGLASAILPIAEIGPAVRRALSRAAA
ncbi:MAG: CheB methylesterase domain-containing protein, partial [Azospirillaceae bacterium]